MASKPKSDKKAPAAKKEKAPAAKKAVAPQVVKPTGRAKKEKEPVLPPLEKRMAETEFRQIDPKSIRLDGKTQFRVSHSKEAVDDYADRMEAGDQFPPVKLVEDAKKNLWPYDGHHTVLAAIKAGRILIDADIIPGSQREAQYLALAANRTNGLHRTLADRRNAAIAMLSDDEWSHMSNREIARHLGISDPTIGKIRGELKAEKEAQGRKDAVTGQMALPGTDEAAKQAAWEKEQAASRETANGKIMDTTKPGDDTPAAPAADAGLSDEERQTLKDAASDDAAAEHEEGDETPSGDDEGTQQEGTGATGDAAPPSPAVAGTTNAPQPPVKPKADNRSDEQKREDARLWIEATNHIQQVLGDEMVEALQDGRVNLSEQDVIRYGSMSDEDLNAARQSMLNNWPHIKHARFVQGIVNGDSTLAELVNKTIAQGGSYSMTLNGYGIVVSKQEEQ